MKKAKTKSYTVELPVSVSTGTERQLTARLLAGSRLYNAVLGEALKRLDLMRESKAWQAARKLIGKSRSEAFQTEIKKYAFSSASLSSFATQCKNSAGWKNRLSANEMQRIAETAFSAVQQYSFGKRGHPRFKNRNRPLKSFSGKKNSTGIRYRQELGVIEWAGLILPIQYCAGKDLWLDEALNDKTKFCRLVWRNVKGRRRWYAQLVQEGVSPDKDTRTTRSGEAVGLDVGPSTVAVVSKEKSDLITLCPTINYLWSEVRRLQRAMDRSRRATNPQCYNADGTWKKGARIKVRSKNYLKLQNELREAERKLAAERKRSHGEQTNDIIRLGNIIKGEKLSYVAFQKNYGRSVKVKAPGDFIAQLKRKAERAGGQLEELNTWTLKMSQYDHVSAEYTKKPLKQRWHYLGGEAANTLPIVQRDIYSAFLAYCVRDNGHHPSHLKSEWAGVKPHLEQSGWCRQRQFASGGAIVLPTVTPTERIGCSSGTGMATARMV